MRITKTAGACAIINNLARRMHYQPRRRGMTTTIWQAVNETHPISLKCVRQCLREYTDNGECVAKQGKLFTIGKL
jgi:hypothetical protein